MKTTKANREMLFASNCAFGFDQSQFQLEEVRQHLAQAMVGKTVDLLNGRAIAHGVVSGVMLLAGHPKLLVNGRAYDLNQVLTASPA